MSGLILPESIKRERAINEIEVVKYKGFLTVAIQIPNAYETREELARVLPNVMISDADWKRYGKDKIWWATGLNEDIGVQFFAIGGDKNEAGRNLLKTIDLFVRAKYGQN